MADTYMLYCAQSYPRKTGYHVVGSQGWSARLLGQANLREKWKARDGLNTEKLGGIEGQAPGSSAESDLKNQLTGPAWLCNLEEF